MLESGLISDDDFRDFTFVNPARLYAGTNPDFYKGTRASRRSQSCWAWASWWFVADSTKAGPPSGGAGSATISAPVPPEEWIRSSSLLSRPSSRSSAAT